ncbi:MAG TPA: hypothetical protein VFB85_21630 [Vicinamibacterales bacterium]|nr:hypothetical protein [Vicinamibacterales bacterium]
MAERQKGRRRLRHTVNRDVPRYDETLEAMPRMMSGAAASHVQRSLTLLA